MDLAGRESALARQVEHSLSSADGPVAVLDVGGGLGASMARLAGHFAEEVADGRVVFVNSNLAKAPADPLRMFRGDIALAELTAFEQGIGRVHQVVGDVDELKKMEVPLPNGESLPLDGNVALAHEDFALTHGVVNDRDWPLLGSMLRDDGSLWSDTLKSDRLHPREGEPVAAAAHRVGRQNLEQMGVGEIPVQWQANRGVAVYARQADAIAPEFRAE